MIVIMIIITIIIITTIIIIITITTTTIIIITKIIIIIMTLLKCPGISYTYFLTWHKLKVSSFITYCFFYSNKESMHTA